MSRNRYDDAFGVVRIKWVKGEPERTPYVVLCEVWEPTLLIAYEPDTKPRVSVSAHIEARVYKDNAWRRIGYNGSLFLVEGDGQVRRHATLVPRSWFGTVALDGWSKE